MYIYIERERERELTSYVKTFVARRRHEGSKETSLARIKGKNIIAKRFDSYAAVIISGSYRKAGEMLA